MEAGLRVPLTQRYPLSTVMRTFAWMGRGLG